MNIKLNFINRSNDSNNSKIVIFQKNVAADFDEMPVAWKVIANGGQPGNHPFTFPMTMAVGASDGIDNHLPQVPVENGQMFHVAAQGFQAALSHLGASVAAKQVQLQNNLQNGAIQASIYKAGKLLATKASVDPGQKAVFEFNPTIWIGAVLQTVEGLVEGKVMNSAIMSTVNTELSLLGIASADIVMTGGGPGLDAKPFTFSLENVVTV